LRIGLTGFDGFDAATTILFEGDKEAPCYSTINMARQLTCVMYIQYAK
jgi:hypothetical protein